MFQLVEQGIKSVDLSLSQQDCRTRTAGDAILAKKHLFTYKVSVGEGGLGERDFAAGGRRPLLLGLLLRVLPGLGDQPSDDLVVDFAEGGDGAAAPVRDAADRFGEAERVNVHGGHLYQKTL